MMFRHAKCPGLLVIQWLNILGPYVRQSAPKKLQVYLHLWVPKPNAPIESKSQCPPSTPKAGASGTPRITSRGDIFVPESVPTLLRAWHDIASGRVWYPMLLFAAVPPAGSRSTWPPAFSTGRRCKVFPSSGTFRASQQSQFSHQNHCHHILRRVINYSIIIVCMSL